MATAQQTAEIRKQFKANGIKASVRIDHNSIRVAVKSGDIKLAERIASKAEDISRCEATGEILCGVNTYVFVDWDREVLKAKTEEIRGEFMPQIESFAPNSGLNINGWTVARGNRDYYVASPSGESRTVWGTECALETIARMMLESN